MQRGREVYAGGEVGSPGMLRRRKEGDLGSDPPGILMAWVPWSWSCGCLPVPCAFSQSLPAPYVLLFPCPLGSHSLSTSVGRWGWSCGGRGRCEEAVCRELGLFSCFPGAARHFLLHPRPRKKGSPDSDPEQRPITSETEALSGCRQGWWWTGYPRPT